MDRAIVEGMRKIVEKGEKTGQVKSAKLKVKFDTKAEDRKDKLAKKLAKK